MFSPIHLNPLSVTTPPKAPCALIFAWQYPAQSETFVAAHARSLRECGWKVSIIAHIAGAVAPTEQPADGVDYWPAPRSRQQILQMVWREMRHIPIAQWPRLLRTLVSPRRGRLARLLRMAFLENRGFRGCVAHAHFAQQGDLVAQLCGSHFRPLALVVTLHGFDVNRPVQGGEKPYAALWSAADRVVVGTRFMRGQAERLGCPARKILVQPVGVDLGRFAWVDRSARAAGSLNILAVCRLVPYKGVDLMLRALAEVHDRWPDMQLRIVGTGPELPALRHLAQQLQIGERVHFLGIGSHQEVIVQMQAADVFVHVPCARENNAEGQGLVVQEAQATGLPALVSRHGGVPEGVREGVTALISDEGNASEISKHLVWLVENPQMRWRMGQQGRDWVETEFNHDNAISRLTALYALIAPQSVPSATTGPAC